MLVYITNKKFRILLRKIILKIYAKLRIILQKIFTDKILDHMVIKNASKHCDNFTGDL